MSYCARVNGGITLTVMLVHCGEPCERTAFISRSFGFSGSSTARGERSISIIASIIRRRATSRCQIMPHVKKAEKRERTLMRNTKRSVEGSPRLLLLLLFDCEVDDEDGVDTVRDVVGVAAMDDIAWVAASYSD